MSPPRAEYVRNCLEDGEGAFTSYLVLYKCGLSDSAAGLIFLVPFLVILVIALGSTADAFLMPQLNYLSDLLKLSPDVAGVTLLALGNGAPDVFSAIAIATSKKDESLDLSFMLADVIGGTVFIITVVVGVVIFIASSRTPGWTISKLPFWRDSLMLIIGVSLVLRNAADGKITLFEAIAFLFMWLLYIVIVVTLPPILKFAKRKLNLQQQPSVTRRSSTMGQSLLQSPMSSLTSPLGGGGMLAPLQCSSSGEPIQIASPGARPGMPMSKASALSVHSLDDMPGDSSTFEPMQMETPGGGGEPRRSSNVLNSLLGEGTGDWFWTSGGPGDPGGFLGAASGEETGEGGLAGLDWPDSDAGVFERVIYFVEWPIYLMRWLTIPSSDGEWSRRRRIFTALCPPFASLIFAIGPFLYGDFHSAVDAKLGETDMPMLVLLPLCSLVLSALLWLTTSDEKVPVFMPLLVIAGFVMTIVWLNLIATEMIAMMESFGHILGVSTSILALTVLAIGNSVGDLVADMAAARGGGGKNAVRMALAACFGSPVIMNIVSVGVSFMLRMLVTGDNVATYDHVSALTRLGYLFFYITMALHLTIIPLNGYSAPKWYGLLLIVLYCFLLLLSVMTEVGFIEEHWLCVSFRWMFGTCEDEACAENPFR